MAQTDPGQVFRDAADAIRRDGWQKGAKFTGRHCAYDALAEAMGLEHNTHSYASMLGGEPRVTDTRWWNAEKTPAGDHLRATLREQLDDPYALVTTWNDQEATEDDVIALLEKAATSAPVDL